MGRVEQHAVALAQGFVNQAELAVFQVADAAVQHVGGGRAGAAAEVAALDQEGVDAIQSQIAKCADAVDAAADDEHGDFGIGAEGVKGILPGHHSLEGGSQ